MNILSEKVKNINELKSNIQRYSVSFIISSVHGYINSKIILMCYIFIAAIIIPYHVLHLRAFNRMQQ